MAAIDAAYNDELRLLQKLQQPQFFWKPAIMKINYFFVDWLIFLHYNMVELVMDFQYKK